jgi:hypothetical protein
MTAATLMLLHACLTALTLFWALQAANPSQS